MKNGGNHAFWGAMAEYTKSCFYTVLAHRRARGFYTLTRCHDLVFGRGWSEIDAKCSLMYQESKSGKIMEFAHCVRATRVKTRAHTLTRVNSKNAPNRLKCMEKILYLILSILIFECARTRTSWRAYRNLMLWINRYWPELNFHQIWLENLF